MQVEKKSLAITALVVVLVLLLWYRVVYSSMASQASKAKEETQQAQSEVSSLQAKIRQVQPDAKQGEAKKPSLGELQAAIPDDTKVAEFLRQSDQILQASGAQFQTITPGAQTAAGAVGSVAMNISVNGSESAVNEYIDRLMALPRLVEIDTVNFTSSSVSGDAATSGPRAGPAIGQVFATQDGTGGLLVGAQISARVFTSTPPVVASKSSSSASSSSSAQSSSTASK